MSIIKALQQRKKKEEIYPWQDGYTHTTTAELLEAQRKAKTAVALITAVQRKKDTAEAIQLTPTPVTTANARLHMRVFRGQDWKWYSQDQNPDGQQTTGTIIPWDYSGEDTETITWTQTSADDEEVTETWVRVKWDRDADFTYRIHPQHDLSTLEPDLPF